MTQPTATHWTEAQMRASLAASLAHWDGHRPLWVFGYGSLIWKPEFEFEAREPARIHGYHRRLCLRSVTYRGTRECPGIVAGLDRGGSCLGMAYRIGAARVRNVFSQLWEREMFLGSYRPTWMRARLLAGGAAEALGLRHLIMNSSHVALPLVFGAAGSVLGARVVYLLMAVVLVAAGLAARRVSRGKA